MFVSWAAFIFCCLSILNIPYYTQSDFINNKLYPMSKPFVVPSTGTTSQSPIYRHSKYTDGTHGGRFSNINTLYELFLANAKENPQNNFLGSRPGSKTGAQKDYRWMTATDVANTVDIFGSCLDKIYAEHSSDVNPTAKQQPLGIFSVSRPEWIIAEQAAFRSRRYTVGISDISGAEHYEQQINKADIRVIVCSIDKIPRLLSRIGNTPTLKVIISLDSFDLSNPHISALGFSHANITRLTSTAKSAGIILLDFNSVLEQGRALVTKSNPPEPSDIATLIFKPLNDGNLQGVVHTHQSILHSSRSMFLSLNLNATVHLSHLPLEYFFERSIVYMFMHCEVSIGFFSGDNDRVLDDMQALRPTVFVTDSGILNQIFKKQTATSELPIYNVKKSDKCPVCHANYSSFSYDSDIETVYWGSWNPNNILLKTGGRVSLIISSSSRLKEDVRVFYQTFLLCNITCFIGLTEAGAIALISIPDDRNHGHVGISLPGIDLRLKNAHKSSHKVSDKPYPRGELMIRSNSMFSGYLKNPETPNNVVDDEWFATGLEACIKDNGTFALLEHKNYNERF